MTAPITLQNLAYTGFTGVAGTATKTFSTGFAYGIPTYDGVTTSVYELSHPDEALDHSIVDDHTVIVTKGANTPEAGTMVIAFTVPADSFVRSVSNGNVFKEDTLVNLFKQVFMVAGAVAEGRLSSVVTDIDMGGFKLTNAGDPTNAQDYVTLSYGEDNFGGAAATAAEAAQTAAETAQASAETALSSALTAQTGAETAQTAAEAAQAAAEAATGKVTVSNNDTTPGDLETKLLAGTGLSMSTANDGANETRTVKVSDATAYAMAGFDDTGAFSEIFLGNGLVRDASTLAIDKATTAQMVSETSNKIATADNIQYHPGVPKVELYYAKSSSTILHNRGVSSVTDTGTGYFQVNFSNDFEDVYYVVAGSCEYSALSAMQVYQGTRTVSSCRIQTGVPDTGSGGSAKDVNTSVVIYGNLA